METVILGAVGRQSKSKAVIRQGNMVLPHGQSLGVSPGLSSKASPVQPLYP